MTHGLSKSRLANWRQCPKRLWLHVHRPDLAHYADEAEQRFRIGFQVGEVARSLHPDGILIDAEGLDQALSDTQKTLAEHPDKPLFEATFQRDGVLIRADVLLPEPGGYRLREVKASTGVKPEHLEDCAIQTWVAEASVRLTDVELTHVDNAFVYPGGGDYRGLLRPVPVAADIAALQTEIPRWVADARTTLAGAEPAIATGDQCNSPYVCPFQDYCTASQPAPAEFPLDVLPRLTGWRLQSLVDLGIRDVRDIPSNALLTAAQARVARVIKAGVAELDPAAAGELQRFPYPRYYLDFETIRAAVPSWAGTRPYQQLPVQWSCHVETAPGELRHHAFLAEGFDDPRRRFAEQLLSTIDTADPVFVYKQGFEIARLRELADEFPDLAPRLSELVERMVDLLPITKNHYCHPAMKGSWSLKAVLPTIAPDLGYDRLDVADGGDAADAWLEIYHCDTTEERRTALRQSLADFCALDTLACVRLAWFLSGR